MSVENNSCEGEMKTADESNTELNNAYIVLDSQELNESELDIMKGDAIGDTVYSARWIIKTLKALIEISDENFNSPMEGNMEMLWDMAANKDVAMFLLKFDIFQVINHALRTTSNPRLAEILLGIVGNLCCHNEAMQKLAENDNLINAIFQYLTDDDADTLIQTIRIFEGIVWELQTNKTLFWMKKIDECNLFGKSICFILVSSKKEQLLSMTLKFVSQIATMSKDEEKYLDKWFEIDHLMISIFESFAQLFKNNIADTENDLSNVKNWLIVYHYIVQCEEFNINPKFENDSVYSNTTKVLEQILRSFSMASMIPMKDTFCIGIAVEIMMWFLKKRGYYETDVIALLPSILICLKTDIERFAADEDLTEERELINFLEKNWLYVRNSLDRKNLFTIKVTCKNILKIERNISDDDLPEMVQSLKIGENHV